MKVTGSLQEKNGIYQMIVRVPDINGNLKQKSKSTRIKIQGKNKRETTANKHKADLMLAEWMETLSQTESYGADKDLIEAIEDWLAMKKKQIRPNSYESYLNTYEVHVKPYFEKKKLKLGDVTARVVMQYVRTKEDAGLSRKSIRKHLVILNGVFTEAIAMGELNYNPCANITVKDNRDDHFEGTAYDIATAKRLLEAVKGDPIEPAVYLGLFLGLLQGETVLLVGGHQAPLKVLHVAAGGDEGRPAARLHRFAGGVLVNRGGPDLRVIVVADQEHRGIRLPDAGGLGIVDERAHRRGKDVALVGGQAHLQVVGALFKPGGDRVAARIVPHGAGNGNALLL